MTTKQITEDVLRMTSTNSELKQALIDAKVEVEVLRHIRKHYEDKFKIRMYASGQFDTIEEA